LLLDNRDYLVTTQMSLRSQSGSSGPTAKEESPLPGGRPILVFGERIRGTGFEEAVQTAALPIREPLNEHSDKGQQYSARGVSRTSVSAPHWIRDASANGGLKQRSDFVEDAVHAEVGIDDGIDFVVVGAGVHDENLGFGVCLSDHVGQVMAVVLG